MRALYVDTTAHRATSSCRAGSGRAHEFDCHLFAGLNVGACMSVRKVKAADRRRADMYFMSLRSETLRRRMRNGYPSETNGRGIGQAQMAPGKQPLALKCCHWELSRDLAAW
jgi:hypothetical protein